VVDPLSTYGVDPKGNYYVMSHQEVKKNNERVMDTPGLSMGNSGLQVKSYGRISLPNTQRAMEVDAKAKHNFRQTHHKHHAKHIDENLNYDEKDYINSEFL
jgi:hypothetical protein